MSENFHIRHAGTPYCYANELACHIFRGLKREEEKKKQQKPLHLETDLVNICATYLKNP